MFGRRFFGGRYYAARYFGDGGVGGSPPPLESLPGNAALDIMRIKRHRTTSKGAR